MRTFFCLICPIYKNLRSQFLTGAIYNRIRSYCWNNIRYWQGETEVVADTRPAILGIVKDGHTEVVLGNIRPLVSTHLSTKFIYIMRYSFESEGLIDPSNCSWPGQQFNFLTFDNMFDCLYMFMRIFDNRWGCVLLSSSTSMLDLPIMFVMVVWLQKRTLKWEHWEVKWEHWEVKWEHWTVKWEHWAVKWEHWAVKWEHWTVKWEHWAVKWEHWAVKWEHWAVKWEHWTVKWKHWAVKGFVQQKHYRLKDRIAQNDDLAFTMTRWNGCQSVNIVAWPQCTILCVNNFQSTIHR